MKGKINKDILVIIPDEDLPKLAELYKEHVNWAPHAYSVIIKGIKWKKITNKNFVTFMSPNNCWTEDGTFFAIFRNFNCQDLFIFTLDRTCKNLYKGMSESRLLHSEQPTNFHDMHNSVIPTVNRIINENNLKIKSKYSCNIFYVPKEKALNFDIICPPEVFLKKLEPSMAPFINSVWPHRYPNSEKFLSIVIELNGGFGVFLKSNGELVAWMLVTILGQMGVLQTVEAHRRKGYATLVTRAMSKKLAEEGISPFGTVVVGNVAPEKMFEKIGFKNVGQCVFFEDVQI